MTYGPYPATVLDVHDGDTVRLDLDLGFGMHQTELRCRVYGINAPELNTASGSIAASFLKTLLPVGCKVKVLSHGWDKYGGRFDGEITTPQGESVAGLMLAAGYAVKYTP